MRALCRARALAGIVTAAALVIAPTACAAVDDGDSGTSASNQEPPSEETDSSPSESNAGSNDTPSANAADNGGTSDDDSDSHNDASGNDDKPEKPDRPRGRLFTVTEVVDGDTVHLDKRGETSVRIIGIETPETVHPSEPVECGGPAASNAAEQLLAGQQVRLVYDPTQGRTDSYGRVLGYLEVPGVGDYGLAMIKRGHAAEYTYATAYQRQQRYKAAEQRAQNNSRGLWAQCGGVDTPLEQPTTEPEPEPDTAAPPAEDPGADCAPGYSPCVPAYPPDLDCGDVDGPINITGDDPHGFDADGDGIGCDT